MDKYLILASEKDMDFALCSRLEEIDKANIVIPFDKDLGSSNYIYVKDGDELLLKEINKLIKYFNLNQFVDASVLNIHVDKIDESNSLKKGDYVRHLSYGKAPLLVDKILKKHVVTTITIRNKKFEIKDTKDKFIIHDNPAYYLYDTLDIPSLKGVINIDCDYLLSITSEFDEIIKLLLRIKITNQNRIMVFINPNEIMEEVALALELPTYNKFIPSEIIFSDKKYLYHNFEKVLIKHKINLIQESPDLYNPVYEAIIVLKENGTIKELFNKDYIKSITKDLDNKSIKSRFKKYYKDIIDLTVNSTSPLPITPTIDFNITHDYSIFEKYDMYWYIENYDIYHRILRF